MYDDGMSDPIEVRLPLRLLQDAVLGYVLWSAIAEGTLASPAGIVDPVDAWLRAWRTHDRGPHPRRPGAQDFLGEHDALFLPRDADEAMTFAAAVLADSDTIRHFLVAASSSNDREVAVPADVAVRLALGIHLWAVVSLRALVPIQPWGWLRSAVVAGRALRQVSRSRGMGRIDLCRALLAGRRAGLRIEQLCAVLLGA